MKLFDFLCQGCGEVFESFGNQVGDETPCPICNSTAKAILSGTRFHLDGTDPGYPTAWNNWAKKHRSRRSSQDD